MPRKEKDKMNSTRVADVSEKERTTDHRRLYGIKKTSTQTVCEEIFCIVGGGWRHRGRTNRRSSKSTHGIKRTATQTACEEIFFIVGGS